MPRPKKRLGQHFLSDPRILGRIADALEAEPGDTVLEIGPGPGGLTAQLTGRVGRLIAIEKDADLIAPLQARFPTLELVHGDALELDWHRLAGPEPFRVIGNIPYNITTPLIDLALKPPRPVSIVFLVQQEVAERIAATPGGRDYGALSVGVQAVASVQRLFTISAGSFSPPPKVGSAVIRLRPRSTPLVTDLEAADFRRFVVGLFSFRRKQLGRGLRQLTGAEPSVVAGWLGQANLGAAMRPEEVAGAGFVALFRATRGSGVGGQGTGA